MTSWLLVIYASVHGGMVPAFVPNLASSDECIRVAKSISKDKNHGGALEYRYKCVEVYNAKEKQ